MARICSQDTRDHRENASGRQDGRRSVEAGWRICAPRYHHRRDRYLCAQPVHRAQFISEPIRLGYSSLVPTAAASPDRSRHARRIQKKLASASRRSRRTIPTDGCKSFTKTKRGSGQQGTLTRVWARTGSRPRAVRQTQYGYVYVLAATCRRCWSGTAPVTIGRTIYAARRTSR